MKILCVRNRKEGKKKKAYKYVRRMCVETGQTLPFPGWGRDSAITIQRRGEIFPMAASALGCWWGAGAGLSSSCPHSAKGRAGRICMGRVIADRCLFGPAVLLVSFFFPI